MGLRIERSILSKFKSIIMMTMSFALVIGSVSFAAPQFFSQVAKATTAYTAIPFTPSEVSTNWSTDRTAPSGGHESVAFGGRSDVLEMRVNTANASPTTGFYRTEGLQRQIAASDTVKADLYVEGDWAAKDVRAGLWAVGKDASDTISAYPIVEFISGNGGSYTGWRIWDGVNGGWTNTTTPYNSNAWNTLEISLNTNTDQFNVFVNGAQITSKAGGGTANISAVILNNFNAANNNAAFDYAARWSNLAIGDIAASATVAPCLVTKSIHTTDISTWNTSETRANGHNNIESTGLHVWTDTDATGSPDPRKAAGYYATDFALSALSDKTIAQSIDYQATTGITPGLQLVVDLDNNGTNDGILVGESVYGNNWWLTSGSAQFAKDAAPHNGGGNGSLWYGTPNEWLASFPDANVKAIGYSLGSGVNADGVIKKISLGCTDYTFGLAPPVVPAALLKADNSGNSIASNGYTNSKYFTFQLTSPGATRYQLKYWNDIPGSPYKEATPWSPTDLSPYSSSFGVYKDNFTQGEGKHYFAFSSCNAAHVCSAFSDPYVVTYDVAAPAVPLLLSPSDNAFIATNDFWFDWTDVDGAVSYEMQNSTNPAVGADGSFQNVMWTGDYQQIQPTESKARSLGASGTWYWQVRAVDAAGNKSAWTSPWKVTIDTVAPSAPQNLTLKDSHGTLIVNNGTTKSYEVTAGWDGVNDAVSYEYKYWNNISSSAYNTESSAYIVNNGNNLMRSGVFNQGEGTHHIQVRAFDAAGNPSSWSSTFTVTYDITPPVLTIDPIADSSDKTPTITGTTNEIDQPVIVTVEGVDYVATVNSNGTWYTNVSKALVPGTYTISVKSTDSAGNSATSGATLIVTEATAGEDNIATPTLSIPLAEELPVSIVGGITTVASGTPNSVSTIIQNTNDGAVTEDVLGAQTKNSDTKTAAETTAVIAPTTEGWKIFGLLWYWWILILALIGSAWWLIAARRRQAQDV